LTRKRFVVNLNSAREALQGLGSPFGLRICGWAGPPDISHAGQIAAQGHRLQRDQHVHRARAGLGRISVVSIAAKWAIPWFEDDGALTSLPVARRTDAPQCRDARNMACNGLMGLHWRTRIIAPNISALAQAGWEQGGMEPAARAMREEGARSKSSVARRRHSSNDQVSRTEIVPSIKTVRFDLRGYRFAVPDGNYK